MADMLLNVLLLASQASRPLGSGASFIAPRGIRLGDGCSPNTSAFGARLRNSARSATLSQLPAGLRSSARRRAALASVGTKIDQMQNFALPVAFELAYA